MIAVESVLRVGRDGVEEKMERVSGYELEGPPCVCTKAESQGDGGGLVGGFNHA